MKQDRQFFQSAESRFHGIDNVVVEEREGVAYLRGAGTTSTLKFGEFHKITQVSPRGCWTLFFMYRKRGGWGFKSQ